jgi:hypothetical protein
MADEILTRTRVTARRFGGRTMRRGVVASFDSTGVLRGPGDPAQGVRQLAGEVQGRASAAGAQAALPTRRVKSHPSVPPARDGHRRRFSEPDKRRILEEAAEPNASLAKIARRYGIARRFLCRWKQELAPPVFVAVQIADTGAPSGVAPADEECVP